MEDIQQEHPQDWPVQDGGHMAAVATAWRVKENDPSAVPGRLYQCDISNELP